jgi:hypothetical protein
MPGNAPIVATLQDFPGLPAGTSLTVECSLDDLPRLRGGLSPEQVRCKTVGEDRLEELVRVLDAGIGDTAVVARSRTPRELLAVLPLLRRTKATLVVDACGPSTAELVIAAVSLGVPVELDPAAGWTAEALREIAEYFLHSPALSTGVAPLVGLVDWLSATERTDLRELRRERLGRHFHVDAEGRVSLSPRFAAQGRHFGRVGDPPETLAASELWRSLETLHRRIFVDLAPCSTCRHYPFCQGLFVDPSSTRPDCGPWRACLDHVADTLGAERAGG